MRYLKTFEVGDRVRVKRNKGKLDKKGTPNWSLSIFRFESYTAEEHGSNGNTLIT